MQASHSTITGAHSSRREKKNVPPHPPKKKRLKDYIYIFISLLAGGKELEANTGIRD
jgi:hypothetical protein